MRINEKKNLTRFCDGSSTSSKVDNIEALKDPQIYLKSPQSNIFFSKTKKK